LDYFTLILNQCLIKSKSNQINVWLNERKINCYNFGYYFILFVLFNNKIGGILYQEGITAAVNNKSVNKKGKMNIIRNQKRVPHTIVKIPTKNNIRLKIYIISYFFLFFYN
jgi:hypothetical protein